MFTIRLFCNQGMSTSLLVNKMREAASSEGLETSIEAFPVGELADRLSDVDVALLGPQVGYLKAKCASICQAKNVPMDVIPMVDYGMCNGANVLRFAKKLAGK